MDEWILKHIQDSDVVIHAGDWGNAQLIEYLEENKKKWFGVFGNIDGEDVRRFCPESIGFTLDNVSFFMTHIAKRNGQFLPFVKSELAKSKASFFICGHSHILKVKGEGLLNAIYINPGAAGKKGFHNKRTMIRFSIIAGKVKNMYVIEKER